MCECGSGKPVKESQTGASHPPERSGDSAADTGTSPEPLAWFHSMVPKNLNYVKKEKEKGRGLVGIMCEYTPRELIFAAGAMPVCLCGGDANMIPAAEETLPANLCPLIKSTYGYSVKRMNPFLERADLLVAETTCDGKKKMYELLNRQHPMIVLELPQKPDTDQAFAHWLEELKMLRRELEIRFNVTISNADLEEAIKMMNRERALKRKLADLMMEEEPPLSGRELLDLKALVSCIPADMEQYEKALEVLPGRRLNPPAGERIRVLLTGVPFPHMAERVLDIIESNGGLVVCQENCTGIKPVLEDVTEGSGDPLRAIAEKYFHLPCSVMTANEARLESLRALVDRYRPQAIIEIIWQACITYDVESYLVHDFVEKELKLPYLKIETDYSPSDSARIALRVEALFETIQNR